VIAHLAGALLDKQVQRLVIDVGGVGYEVFVPLSTFYGLGDPGSRVALRIHTHVRDSAIQLFGFATALEMALFERLISVSGIGPRVALAVLSGIEPADLVRAVRQSDVARLTRIPGVGRKTAERILVELRDRLPEASSGTATPPAEPADEVRNDVLSALANLGYQPAPAESALKKVLRDHAARDFETVLRLALKTLAG
jgi:Holliday junction DNA helicase RuvA